MEFRRRNPGLLFYDLSTPRRAWQAANDKARELGLNVYSGH